MGDQLIPRKPSLPAAGSTLGSFNLVLCGRSSDKTNRSAARVNQLNWAFAHSDLRGDFFCNNNFCHDSILSPQVYPDRPCSASR
jgi:hypothetical protein